MKKRNIKLGLLLLFTLLLSSCGIKSEESMKVNKNFKGERIIRLVLDENTFNRANGGKDAVINFLSENVIEPLELNYIKDEPNLIEIEYSIKFENKEEYLDKIKQLYQLGNVQEDISLDFNIENKRFNKAVEFYDNSDVQKILSPVINKALEENLIFGEDYSRIWDTKNYTLTINGIEYIKNSTSTYGSYSEKDYIGPKSINVITSKSNNDNKFNRVLSLYFSEENYLKLKNNWEKDFILNSNVKFEDDEKKHSVKFIYEDFTQEEINKETSYFFGAESLFSMEIKNGGKSLKVVENLKDFIGENEISKSADVKYLYYFDKKSVDDYPGEENLIENNSNERMVYADSKDVNFGLEKNVEVDVVFNNINIQNLLGEKNLKRVIIFPKKNQEEIVNNNLKSYLKSLGIEYHDSKNEVKIEYVYDFEKGSNIHNKLYKNKITLNQSAGKLFKSTQKLTEEGKFRDIKAKKIDYSSNKGDLTKITEQNFHQNDQFSYSYKIAYETTKINSIYVILGIILALILSIFLGFKLLGKNSKISVKDNTSVNDDISRSNNKVYRKVMDKSNRKILIDDSNLSENKNNIKENKKNSENKEDINQQKVLVSVDDGKIYYREDEYI